MREDKSARAAALPFPEAHANQTGSPKTHAEKNSHAGQPREFVDASQVRGVGFEPTHV